MLKKIAASFLVFAFLVVQISLPKKSVHAADYQDITFGTTVNGNISSQNTYDGMYRIVLSEAGRVNINVASQMEETHVDLLAEDGDEITGDYLLYPSAENPVLKWDKSVDLEPGTYFFKVANMGYDGQYTVNVTFDKANNNDIEPNNEIATAQSLILNADAIKGFMSWSDNKDVYKIELPKAGKLNLNLVSPFNAVDIYLKNANDDNVLTDYLTGATEQAPKTWSKTLDLEAGTYYLVLSTDRYTGVYSLKADFTEVNNNDIESNNDINTAQALELNKDPLTGYLTMSDSQDVYKIVLPKAGKLNVNVTSEVESLTINLENSKGEDFDGTTLNIGSDKEPQNWKPSFDLEAGTYYLKINSNDTGVYTVNAGFTEANNDDVEPNNEKATAQLLNLNSSETTGYLSVSDDKDVYKLVLPKSGKIDINLVTQVNQMHAVLEKEIGTEIVSEDSYDGSEQNPKTWSQSLDLEAGTYYLKISKYDRNTGIYKVKVNYTEANNDDIEPNDGIVTAQTLDINTNGLTGYLPFDDKQDVYKIELPSAGKLNINLISQIYFSDVEIDDSLGNEIKSDYVYYGSEQEPTTWDQSLNLEPGTYYLRITPEQIYNATNTGKYHVMASFTAANNNDIEPNNGTTTAQRLTLNSNPIVGFLSWSDNQDIYRIDLPKAGRIDVDFSSQVSYMYIDLQNVKGAKIFTDTLGNSSEQDPKIFRQTIDLPAGTYYFKALKSNDNSTGKYSIKVNYKEVGNTEIEPNDGTTAAQTLVLNTNPISGYLPYSDTKDVYKVELTKTTKIGINATSWMHQVSFNLTNSNGTSVWNDYLYEGSDENPQDLSESVTLSAGTYYLTASRYEYDPTGRYSVGITTFNQVAFNSNGGSVVGTQAILNNNKAVIPAAPSKSGYTFGGWFKENTFVNTFDFANAPITTDVTLYAKWIMNPPVAPINVTAASYGTDSIKTSWSPVSGAAGYEIYKASSISGTYTKVGETTSTSYVNSGLIAGTDYYYKVKAYKLDGTARVYSALSTATTSKPIPSKSGSLNAVSAGYNSVKTSWAAVSGATGYEVYRAGTNSGTYSKVGESTTTTFTNTGLTTGTAYYYKIRAYKLVGTTRVYGDFGAVVSGKSILQVPPNLNAARINSTSIGVTWGGVTGATGYEIYRSNYSTGTYSLIKTVTTLSYTNTGLTTGKIYYYKVKAYRLVGSTKIYSDLTTVISARP